MTPRDAVTIEPAAPREIAFSCDCMLGGLCRWLRAAGYDAEFEYHIADAALVARARESGRVLLSSDGGIFERNVVKSGEVTALFVPRHRDKVEQLGFVLDALGLPVRAPRCMACGGAFREVPKADVQGEAPPRTFACQERFFRCQRCHKLFWEGTHWERIVARLNGLTISGLP